MEWSKEIVLEFLEYFEIESLIWNPGHALHKNRNEVHDAWKRIQEKLSIQITIPELKKKKDSLMASFRTCLQKVRASKRTGTGANEVYKPTWFAFEKMESFLKERDQPRLTLNSEVSNSNNNIEIII